MGPATLALWWQTCTGLSSTAAYSCTRPARMPRPESCVCFTSASRWLTWWSVLGAWPRRASRPSWTCSRPPCTAGRPSSWAPRRMCRTYWTSTRSTIWLRCNKGCTWLVSWPGSEEFSALELFWPRSAQRERPIKFTVSFCETIIVDTLKECHSHQCCRMGSSSLRFADTKKYIGSF
uniref:Putative secreted protein n=1 Tax=Ixodes ricinus TaxID=34613 RepID=A0A6B0UYQ7_IXORI